MTYFSIKKTLTFVAVTVTVLTLLFYFGIDGDIVVCENKGQIKQNLMKNV